LSPSPESRVAGLEQVRRWLLLLLLSQAWLFAALAGLTSWSRLGTPDRVLLGISATCLAAGWILSRRPTGLWLLTAAPLCLVIAALLNSGTPGAGQWIALSVSAGHVTYALVLLTPPLVGIAAIIAGPVILGLLWSRRPSNVIPGALDVAGGWVSVASLAVSATALWFVWHSLLRQATADDERMDAIVSRVAQEIEAQERSRLWRRAAVAVHEQLLSTLRYVLQTDALDREGLRRLVHRGDGDSHSSDLAEEVREATAARIAAGIVRADQSALELDFTDEARIATRAAIVECSLNAVLHGGATDVLVTATTTEEWIDVHVSDNGSGIDPDATPGLGWTTTLDAGLAAVGGTWSTARQGDRTVVNLRVPRATPGRRATFTEDGFEQGRILISTPLVAVGAVGVSFDVLAGVASPRGWPLSVVAIVATAAAASIVWRRRHPSLIIASLVILGLASIPWLMAVMGSEAADAPVQAAGLTTAGYALIAVGMWSRWWQWAGGLALWAIGVLAVAQVQQGAGAVPIAVALVNCLVIVPVVIVVAAIGTRRYRRAQAALALERQAILREGLRANSARLIDQHLTACVAQAEDLMGRLADGADLDEDVRREVGCLEGLIRATIQVDPVDAGEFTRVAARLVNAAFSLGISAQVSTLVSSSDQAPLSQDVVRSLESLIPGCDRITVRTLNDGTHDYLSLEVIGSAHSTERYAGMRQLDTGDVRIDISQEADGSAVIMVSRSMATVAI
jgi:signal transduction histidine kinase